jgi:hypothetical protein
MCMKYNIIHYQGLRISPSPPCKNMTKLQSNTLRKTSVNAFLEKKVKNILNWILELMKTLNHYKCMFQKFVSLDLCLKCVRGVFLKTYLMYISRKFFAAAGIWIKVVVIWLVFWTLCANHLTTADYILLCCKDATQWLFFIFTLSKIMHLCISFVQSHSNKNTVTYISHY